MYRRLIINSFALLLSLALIACGTATTQQVNESSAGSNSSPAATTPTQANPSIESAERIVALTSLSADIVYQLDKTKLVGISGSRLLREDDRFKEITKVSEGQTLPSLEKIVALQADLVIGSEGFQTQTLDKLKDLGIATIAIKIDSWDALLDITKTLAQAIGVEPTPLLERYQTFLTDIPNQNPSTLVLVSRQPILAPNKNSWAGDLLTKFKANNLAADLQGQSPVGGYITLSAEKILQENPEVLLVVDPRREGIVEEFKSEPFWSQLKATQNDRVYVFDYYGLVNPGSIDKIEEACTKLREAFAL
ncbi:MAG: ABC transporter substrate-binding protein [Xenococcaceae cyanobacterium]